MLNLVSYFARVSCGRLLLGHYLPAIPANSADYFPLAEETVVLWSVC